MIAWDQHLRVKERQHACLLFAPSAHRDDLGCCFHHRTQLTSSTRKPGQAKSQPARPSQNTASTAFWTIRDSVLHLALTDAVAALAAADPAGFETYREQRRQGEDPFAANRSVAADDVLRLWRDNRQRLVDALGGVDARQRVTWFGPPMSAMSHATRALDGDMAHGQDVFDALELDRPSTPRLKHIAHLGVRTRGYSYAQHGLAPPEHDVHVALTVPGARRGPGATRGTRSRKWPGGVISAWWWCSADTSTTRTWWRRVRTPASGC